MKCQPTIKPVNLYGSNWLQRIEDSSDRFEMVSPMMCKDHQYNDARELIFQELIFTMTPENSSFKRWRTLQPHPRPSRTWRQPIVSVNSNFLPHLRVSGSEKADLNLLESKENVAMYQTPRESQTRSHDYLKKPPMNQHTQQISATRPIPRSANIRNIN